MSKAVDLHHFVPLLDGQGFAEPILPEHTIRSECTASAYELACSISGWQQIYHQLTPGAFAGALQELWLDGIQIYWEKSTHALSQSCIAWPKSFWFGVSPCDDISVDATCDRLLPQHIAIAAGGTEFELFIPNHFSMLGMVIREDLLLDSLVIALQDEELDSTFNRMSYCLVDELKKQKLRTLLLQILKLGSEHPERLTHPDVAKSLQHDIFDCLADLVLSHDVPREDSRLKRKYTHLVNLARDYILAHPYESVSILDLVNHLHVSRRTLQNCFLTTLGVTPLHYLKAIRLNAVRRELESEYSPYSMVQDIAMSWGFWHLSQFAADYKSFFGIKPSDSLARRGCITQQWQKQCHS